MGEVEGSCHLFKGIPGNYLSNEVTVEHEKAMTPVWPANLKHLGTLSFRFQIKDEVPGEFLFDTLTVMLHRVLLLLSVELTWDMKSSSSLKLEAVKAMLTTSASLVSNHCSSKGGSQKKRGTGGKSINWHDGHCQGPLAGDAFDVDG